MTLTILWASNGPHVGSGYGVPTKHITQFLKDDGHDVAIQAFYGVQGGMVNYRGIPIYPAQKEPYGYDVIGDHATHHGADLVITLLDNWVFPTDYNDRFGAKWLQWFPVDGTPVPQSSIMMAEAADYPAVFSKDGVERMADVGVEVTYLPYAVDCDTFKPGDKALARADLGLPQDAFLAVCVAANRGYPSRKGFPELLLAWKRFVKQVPSALLYMHTRMVPLSQSGIFFDPLINSLGLENNVIFTDASQFSLGVPNEDLVTLYQAADVMALPSMAEGFGLPVVEAQACGCPVITTACSAMTELTINGTALTPTQPFWASGLNYWWQMPDVNEIYRALIFYHSQKGERWLDKQSAETVGYIRQEYHYPVVYERYWQPLLERIEGELW